MLDERIEVEKALFIQWFLIKGSQLSVKILYSDRITGNTARNADKPEFG